MRVSVRTAVACHFIFFYKKMLSQFFIIRIPKITGHVRVKLNARARPFCPCSPLQIKPVPYDCVPHEANSIRFAAMRFAESNTRLWGFNEPLITGISKELTERLCYKKILQSLVSDIKYAGRGTRTGAALRWSRTNFLKKESGKRDGVKNVFIVITDGKAQDKDLVEAEGRVSWKLEVVSRPPTVSK